MVNDLPLAISEMLQRCDKVFINIETGPHCIFLYMNLFLLTLLWDIIQFVLFILQLH